MDERNELAERLRGKVVPALFAAHEKKSEEQQAEIAKLRKELESVLEWALTEKAPLREQEIARIREVLFPGDKNRAVEKAVSK